MGCARNEVDSEELAARLESQGWTLVKDAEHAEAVMVNTCGFVDIAKADSINTIIEAADLKESGGATKAVVAVGCKGTVLNWRVTYLKLMQCSASTTTRTSASALMR